MAEKTLAEKMKTMTGYCSACGELIIDLKSNPKKFLPNYSTQVLELSNGTLMKVGVCSLCKLALVSGKDCDKVADKIIKNHITYWDKAKDKPKGHKDLKVIDPNTNIGKFIRKKQLLEHEENLNKLKIK